MARYYFHLDYGEYFHDMEGTEGATLNEARNSAVRFLSEILRDKGDCFWGKPSITISVADEFGLTLWTLCALGTAAPSVAALKP